MRGTVLYLARLAFLLIPETRAFALKAALLSLAGAKLGRNVRICSSAAVIGPGILEVGDDTWIGHQVLICSSSMIKIGKAVDIGPQVYLGTGTHKIDLEGNRSAGSGANHDVVVEDGVWLGVGCVVLPGITVGAKAVVAAGAVVNENVQPRTLVGGVPARVIRLL